MKPFTQKIFSAVFACLIAFSGNAWAYSVPKDNSNVSYFYVFGAQGDPYMGAEKEHTQTIYVDVPANETRDVIIGIYDADTGGVLDWRPKENDMWNTEVEFSVSGSAQLDKQVIGNDREYNGRVHNFGPYQPSQGKKIGDKYRFTVTAKGINGDDANLFNVHISPDSAEAFVYQMTFRLADRRGDKMYFYPEVPAGIRKITVENWDLDSEGGKSDLIDEAGASKYSINDSLTGEWTETPITLNADPARRLKYQITKGIQKFGHAGLRIRDEKGNLLPIYFKKGPKVFVPKAEKPKSAPKQPQPEPAKPSLGCNQFYFDGRSSYDDDKDSLTYEWNFGDGAMSTEPALSHVYSKGGDYKVILKVTDNSGLGCSTSQTEQLIHVNTPPQAALKAPDTACVGNSVTFDAMATQDDRPKNVTFKWAFSDGTTAEGATVTKKFDKGGNYGVTLTVDDNEGTSCSVDSIQHNINVNTPPVAQAGQDVTLYLKDMNEKYTVAFNGSTSSDADKDALTYKWTFGDGTSAEGAKVTKLYDKAGDYTARLTVRDSSGTPCDTSTDTVAVKLNKSPLADAGEDQFVCSGSSLSFDAGASTTEAGETMTYSWDFGDGSTGTGKMASHSYKMGGAYKVVLTVNDGRGTPVSEAVDTINVRINSAPVADLKAVKMICTGEGVEFDASGSSDADGDSLKYTWDFGDGAPKEAGSKVIYKFTKGGSYNVKVSVSDGLGLACSKSTDSVFVKVNTPPVADAGPNLVCCQDQVSAFDGSKSNDPDGDSLKYSWDFGDGSAGTGAETQHAYKQNGTYQVMLTVDDNSGTACSTDSSSFTADVNKKPVPVIKFSQK